MRAPRPLPPLRYPAELPISARREEIVAALRRHRVVIVCGETGSGKTTQLPKMLLEAGALRGGLIGHTQPRRIAARTVAARLAAELPEAPAGFVGHKVRFSDATAAATAIKVMTDGILLAEARHDRQLRQYDALIIDEAHERSLNIDFLLGLLQGLLPRRPDLRIVVTSATIDPQRFADYFGGAPVIEVSGRSYPVEIRYRPLEADADDPVDPGLTAGVLAGLEELSREGGGVGEGDVLVFLPGEREIRETAEAIEQAHGPRLAVLPLYSRLAWSDQQRVFDRRGPRRVVLATNVAETSLTVPGIRAVIDSGLARIARYSARSQLLRLPIEPVSQASANQRAGRCGRIGAGVCLRLYAEEDYAARPPFTPPEVLRTNLANVILQMAVLGLGSPGEFPFLDPPDTRLVNDGYRLLQELEAVDESLAVTDTGRTMARLPLDPRLARMLVAARRHGALAELNVLAAGLSIQDPRERPADRLAAADAAHAAGADPRSDFLTLLALYGRYRAARAERTRGALRRWCAEAFLSAARMREWEDLVAQLGDIGEDLGWTPNAEPAAAETVHRALLAGLLGHVGEKTERGDYLGPRGRRFLIAPGSPLRQRAPRWIMAAQIVETQRVYARLVAAIEPAWVEAAARHLVRRDYAEPEWDERRGIVVARERVTLWGLELASGRRVNYGSVAPEAAREMFVREALVHGRARLGGRFAAENARTKAALAAEEAALRRHTVLVDETEEAALYLARIPPTVHSLAAFERWRAEAERADPRVLVLDAAALRRAAEPPIDRERLPLVLVLAGNQLPVEYRFEPGAAADGATVLVPEPLLAKLSAGEVDWGVPGWLEEKLTALVRGLPKAVRRRLVPAPDVARRVAVALAAERGRPFFAAAAAALGREAGETVTAETLAAIELPAHLVLNLRVLDADGAVVAEGRQLAALRREARRAPAREAAAPRAGTDPWQRAELRRFDFAELPATVPVTRQGVALELHPALVDQGTHASLTLLADAAAAEAATRAGVLRLLALELAPTLRHAEKVVREDRELLLLHQPIGPAGGFAREIAERALARACLPDGVAVPRTAAAFAAAAERGRPLLVESAERLAATLRRVLAEAKAARAALAAVPAGLDPGQVADLKAEYDGLVPAGFVAATPDPWLDSLERYLKALTRRALKLADPRRAVADAQAEYLALRRRLAALLGRVEPGEAPPAALAQLRWQLAEYGVQLFAQDLGTRVPVSAKRLAAAFEAAEGALARR
ncbi:MAG: ATP-dependent RNA helicase HrpA [Proteobacteria bacterium]|nr:ATP-dependent RNA helicase HrpA [Pseudomonadota bacterium]